MTKVNIIEQERRRAAKDILTRLLKDSRRESIFSYDDGRLVIDGLDIVDSILEGIEKDYKLKIKSTYKGCKVTYERT